MQRRWQRTAVEGRLCLPQARMGAAYLFLLTTESNTTTAVDGVSSFQANRQAGLSPQNMRVEQRRTVSCQRLVAKMTHQQPVQQRQICQNWPKPRLVRRPSGRARMRKSNTVGRCFRTANPACLHRWLALARGSISKQDSQPGGERVNGVLPG